MKRIITVLGILLGLGAFSSCQKALDSQMDDRAESEKSVYEYFERSYKAMNLAYYNPVFAGPAYGTSEGGYPLAGYCDEAQAVNQSSCVYSWYNGKVSASDMPLFTTSDGGGIKRWEGLFSSIYHCNAGIHYLTGEDLKPEYDESYRKSFLAQYYCVRALDYLQLIKRWGGVPIIDRKYKDGDDLGSVKRASFAECVDFIFESCDKAMEADNTLGMFRGTQSNAPKLSKGTLMAIKSEAALYAASPLWCEDYEGTEKYTWERAAEITRAALDSILTKGGRLVDVSTSFPIESSCGYGPYDKLFLSAYPWSLSWDTETISQPYYYGNLQSVMWKYNGLPIDNGQESSGACPTQELVDAYDVVSEDGMTAVPLLDLKNPYNEDGTPNFNPAALALGYEDCTEKMYLNRDPRFYGTIWFDGSEVEINGKNIVIETFEGGNCGISLSPANKRNSCTGYYLRKFINPESGTDNGNKDGYFREFRLAELYLNFAEAAFMAYGPDTPVDGMTAREAVNAIRARVGLPGITENGEDFLLRLKNERRVELAFEEHRFFDIRRWSSPDGDLESTDSRVSGMKIQVGDDGRKSYERFNFDRQCYTNKYLKFPVPLDEVRKQYALSGEKWQNQGWE